MDYQDFPAHPLHYVPEPVLAAARRVMADAAAVNDVDRDQAQPLADAVLAEVLLAQRAQRTGLASEIQDMIEAWQRELREREQGDPIGNAMRIAGRIEGLKDAWMIVTGGKEYPDNEA